MARCTSLSSQLQRVLQDPDPSVKGDLPRFLWNFLVERTAMPQVQSGRCLQSPPAV